MWHIRFVWTLGRWLYTAAESHDQHPCLHIMMTSSNGSIIRALLAICAVNSPTTGEFPTQINGWVNSREAGDLRHHRAHCDVTVMFSSLFFAQASVCYIWRGSPRSLCNWKWDVTDSRFAPSQWETALLCNDVSHWLGASLESALNVLWLIVV